MLAPGSQVVATANPARATSCRSRAPYTTGRVAEAGHRAAEPCLERAVWSSAISLLGGVRREGREVGVRDRVGLEGQHRAVERDDVVPAQHRRLARVPAERGGPAGHAGRHEHGGPELPLLQDRQRVLGDVAVAVVEAERDDVVEPLARRQQPGGLDHVDDPVALGGEQVHLVREAPRRDRQRIRIVADPVVEEDPEPGAAGPPARPPGGGAEPRQRGLDRLDPARPERQALVHRRPTLIKRRAVRLGR